MTDVRTLLHDLAADAPRGHGEGTADRVVELHRAQDRRRLRWAGVAAAVAVVVAVVPTVLSPVRSTDQAASAVGSAEDASLFDLPTRGSLADDEDVVAEALAASWEDGIPGNDAGDILDPAPEDRRVLFAGEVPGGQVWTLVMGRTGTQLAYAWFVDVDPADGIDLQLAVFPTRTSARSPIALQDTAPGSGAVVVVAEPGDQVRYAPDGSGSPGDEVDPAYEAMTSVDGVGVAEVATGDDARWVAAIQVVRNGTVVLSEPPTSFDSTSALGPYVPTALQVSGLPSDPDYGPLIARCLVEQDWQVSVSVNGSLSYDEPLTDQELTAFTAALEACETSTGYR